MIAASIVQNGHGLTQSGRGRKFFVGYSAPQLSVPSYAYESDSAVCDIAIGIDWCLVSGPHTDI